MEGRWTLLADSEKNGTWIALGPGQAPHLVSGVPCVPCDDAAIERALDAAVTAIVESNDVILDGEEPADGWGSEARSESDSGGVQGRRGDTMSEIIMRGTRFNVVGLLRLMADEIETGERRSATAFSAHAGDDPAHTFVVQVDEQSRTDTTMTVR